MHSFVTSLDSVHHLRPRSFDVGSCSRTRLQRDRELEARATYRIHAAVTIGVLLMSSARDASQRMTYMVFQPRLFQDPLAFRDLRSDARRLQAHGDEAKVGHGIDLAARIV